MAQDYNNTLNLPVTEFTMRGALPQREPAWVEEWEEKQLYDKMIKKNEGKPLYMSARRPSICQRRHPSWHCSEQGAQGFHRPSEEHERIPGSLHPGLGYPRPAHRAESPKEGRRYQTTSVRSSCERSARSLLCSYVDYQRSTV